MMSSCVKYVASPSDDALAKAGQIAANERLTLQARANDVKTITTAALAEVESRAKDELARIDESFPKLEAAARRPLSPNAEDVAALSYAREAFQAKARSEEDVHKLWDRALVENDRTTLLMLADFGESFIRARRPTNVRDMPLGEFFNQRLRRTEDAVATKEQIAARAELLKLEATRLRLRATLVATKQRLGSVRIQNNQLVDSSADSMRAALRFWRVSMAISQDTAELLLQYRVVGVQEAIAANQAVTTSYVDTSVQISSIAEQLSAMGVAADQVFTSSGDAIAVSLTCSA